MSNHSDRFKKRTPQEIADDFYEVNFLMHEIAIPSHDQNAWFKKHRITDYSTLGDYVYAKAKNKKGKDYRSILALFDDAKSGQVDIAALRKVEEILHSAHEEARERYETADESLIEPLMVATPDGKLASPLPAKNDQVFDKDERFAQRYAESAMRKASRESAIYEAIFTYVQELAATRNIALQPLTTQASLEK